MGSENCDHPSCLELDALIRDCDFTRSRSGGPGGQHRNKVETMVIVTHRPTGVTAQASERRSQHENKTVAISRLRENLAVHTRNAISATDASEMWKSRCRGGKIACSSNHPDFACLLAEALNWIAESQFQMASAAERLGCSTSQLIKFVKRSDAALIWVNRQRDARQLGPLR